MSQRIFGRFAASAARHGVWKAKARTRWKRSFMTSAETLHREQIMDSPANQRCNFVVPLQHGDMKAHTLLNALPLLVAISFASAAERTEAFDKDPKWDGHNNRSEKPEPRAVKQDFGFSATQKCGGA